MGLKADIAEVTDSWRSSSPLIKAWLVLSFFLAISSIASISEAIVKWRGFFADSVSTYRIVIRDPLVAVLVSIGFPQIPALVDASVVYILLLGAGIRWASSKHARDSDPRTQQRDALFLGVAMFGGISAGISYAKGIFSPYDYAIYCFCPLLLPALARVRGISYYYLCILLPLATVGLLGAINSGLTKPLP